MNKMYEIFYDRLKEKYSNVILAQDNSFICANSLDKNKNCNFKIVLIEDEYSKFNNELFQEGYKIVINEYIHEKYIEMYYERIVNSHEDVRIILKEFARYDVISEETYEKILKEFKGIIIRGALCIVDGYMLRPA